MQDIINMQDIIRCFSPNYSERTTDDITTIILHHTVCDLTSALKTLTSVDKQVSSHYLVAKDGTIFQLINEEYKAWHAGVSSWRNIENVNNYSIGIEIENSGYEEYPDAQITSVIELCKDIISRYPTIELRNILGHSDVAPTRKIDPSYQFPWDKLAEAGVGIYPMFKPSLCEKTIYDMNSCDINILQAQLHGFGYAISENGVWDQNTISVIAAFKRHFHPESVAVHGEDTASCFWSDVDQQIFDDLFTQI